MRRSRKLPMVSAGGEPEFTIGEADWRRIQETYGHALSDDVREAIVAATETFLYWEVFERTAEPVANAKLIVEALKNGAKDFQQTLLAHAFKSSDAGTFAGHLIKRNFHDPRAGNKDRLFETLGGVLTSFNTACTNAARELSDPALPSHNEGDAWVNWVWRLTQIMDNVSLPVGVSKDGERISPFVRLVWELQDCLPVDSRRHMHSEAALTDATSKARKKVKLAIAKREKSGVKSPRASPE